MARRRGIRLIPKGLHRQFRRATRFSGKDAWFRWSLIAAGIYAGYVIFLAPKGTPLIPFGLGGTLDTATDYVTGEPMQSAFGGIATNPVTGWGYQAGFERAAATGTDITSLDRILVG